MTEVNAWTIRLDLCIRKKPRDEDGECDASKPGVTPLQDSPTYIRNFGINIVINAHLRH